jgi:hypothetical protein
MVDMTFDRAKRVKADFYTVEGRVPKQGEVVPLTEGLRKRFEASGLETDIFTHAILVSAGADGGGPVWELQRRRPTSFFIFEAHPKTPLGRWYRDRNGRPAAFFDSLGDFVGSNCMDLPESGEWTAERLHSVYFTEFHVFG